MAGAPLGNKNGAKQKRLMADCLKRELTQRPEDLLAIVNKTIDDAKAGDAQARALVFERVDGKLPQPLVGDDNEDPIRTVNRVELVSLE
jgi:hypothetical protein